MLSIPTEIPRGIPTDVIHQHLRSQTDALLTTVDGLEDFGAPSLCTGWTRAHVLSHLARNADGLCNLVSAAHGHGGTMYASDERRDADIEDGARRDRQAITDDLRASAHEVLFALDTLTPADDRTLVERTPGGQTFLAGALPFMRLREVVYHHVDLDAGFTFAELPEGLLGHLLADEVGRTTSPETQARALLWLARGIPPIPRTQEDR